MTDTEKAMHFLEMSLDIIVLVCSFWAFDGAIPWLIFAAYWGIGATIDRNAIRIIAAIKNKPS